MQLSLILHERGAVVAVAAAAVHTQLINRIRSECDFLFMLCADKNAPHVCLLSSSFDSIPVTVSLLVLDLFASHILTHKHTRK